MIYKKFIQFIIILLVILKLPLLAANNSLATHGTNASILSIGYPAAPLALSEANIAEEKNYFAGLYNPASLTGINNYYFSTSHGNIAGDVAVYSLNLTGPLAENLVFNLNWLYMQVPQIPVIATETADLNTDLEAENYSQFLASAFIGAISVQISDRLSLGLSGKLFLDQFSVVNHQGYGFSLNPGLNYRLAENLKLGAYLENAVSKTVWDTGFQETLGCFWHLGIEYSIVDDLNAFAEASSKLSGNLPLAYKTAFEYRFLRFLVFRLGTNFSTLNGGIGISLGNFDLDYTYLGGAKTVYSESSRISLSLKF